VLVERQRRGQNQGSSMKLVERQRSMKLKKKRNMEPVKGNKFVVLQFPELNQISKDVDIKIGHDKSDSITIINDTIEYETRRCEKFARDNPEIMLPMNLDVCNINEPDNGVVQGVIAENNKERDYDIPGIPNNGDVRRDMASP
jgi:hypothetical protein